MLAGGVNNSDVNVLCNSVLIKTDTTSPARNKQKTRYKVNFNNNVEVASIHKCSIQYEQPILLDGNRQTAWIHTNEWVQWKTGRTIPTETPTEAPTGAPTAYSMFEEAWWMLVRTFTAHDGVEMGTIQSMVEDDDDDLDSTPTQREVRMDQVQLHEDSNDKEQAD